MKLVGDLKEKVEKTETYAKSSGKNAIYQQVCNTDANGNNVSYIRIDF